MGSNHFSHILFDVDPQAAREQLFAWMRAKGLALQDGKPLTALDPAHERGVWLAWRDGVVVVLGDTLAELDRQAFELRKLGRPLVELWMHDSDIWGYQLWHEGRIASAFNSNPRYFGPAEPARGPDDPETLCRLVGRGDPVAIRRIQRQRPTFAEQSSRAFAEALAAEAGAAQYGSSPGADWPPPEWEREDLWFRDVGWDPLAGFDIDRLSFEPPPRPDPFAGLTAEERAAAAEQLAAMKRSGQAIGCLLRVATAPFQLPFQTWLRWKTRDAARKAVRGMDRHAGTTSTPRLPPPTAVLRKGRLCNDTAGISIPLPSGATVGPYDCVPLLPGHVLGFTIAETTVRMSAHVPATVRHMTQGMGHFGEVTTETNTIGPHTVRQARVELPPSPEWPDAPHRVRLMSLLIGPSAVLVFDTTPAMEQESEVATAVNEALAGLRFDDAG